MKTYKYLLAILLIIIPAISMASIDTNLSFGSRGQAVTDLQNLLISKGFLNGQASGGFYSLTKQAVVAYQASLGLPTTGFVGPITRQKINSGLSSQSVTSAQTVSNPTVVSPTSPVGSTVAPVQNSTSQTQNSAPVAIPTPVSGSGNPTSNSTPTYITENTPFGPITYLSTIDPTEKAKLFADVQSLSAEAAKNGTLTFTPLDPTEPQPNLEAMRNACTEQPNLFFQAYKGAGISQVVFQASYRAACVIDPNMTWLFSDENPSDAKSGTLGDKSWIFGRANLSAAYNVAFYYFSGVYPGINTFTFTVGTKTATATIYK
jgi:peptidoglycan hydrolase-like protein with peptidoglycan-binding domain